MVLTASLSAMDDAAEVNEFATKALAAVSECAMELGHVAEAFAE